MNAESKHIENLTIPERIRSFVYLVGMLGFPIVVASYVLIVVSNDLKVIDKGLHDLGRRIDERPMSLDKSTDFIIYITDSLRSDLQDDLPELIATIDFTFDGQQTIEEALSRSLTRIRRQVHAYVRPIVRKHQRFAARFPSSGGNIGSLFKVHAPSEDIDAGETEAHLVGKTSIDVSEALTALIMNNIQQFGNIDQVIELALSDDVIGDQLRDIFEDQSVDPLSSEDMMEAVEIEKPDQKSARVERLIEPDTFLELTKDAIETISTVMRDQMLEQVRIGGSDLETSR